MPHLNNANDPCLIFHFSQDDEPDSFFAFSYSIICFDQLDSYQYNLRFVVANNILPAGVESSFFGHLEPVFPFCT